MNDDVQTQREFIAFDLETTGLIAESDRIVEIGAIRFSACGREISRYQCLVNPQRRMSAAAFAIHGLSDDDLGGAAPAREVLPDFLEFLGAPGSVVLMAHNASFDAGFLGSELGRAGLPLPGHRVFDTLTLARRRLPQLPSHRLDALAERFDLDPDGPHRALPDSRRVMQLWLRLEGAAELSRALTCFPIVDLRKEEFVPQGWEPLYLAANRGWAVRIEYEGGSRGSAPRTITPRRIIQRDGTDYVIAYCHLDAFEKSFRLDRIRRFELVGEGPGAAAVLPVD
jgi:DNA polymerase III epsilon subunit family exonuclease